MCICKYNVNAHYHRNLWNSQPQNCFLFLVLSTLITRDNRYCMHTQHHVLFWECPFITGCQRRRHAPWPRAGWGSWSWVPPSLSALAPAHRLQHHRHHRHMFLNIIGKVVFIILVKSSLLEPRKQIQMEKNFVILLKYSFHSKETIILRRCPCDNLLENQNWWRQGTFWNH